MAKFDEKRRDAESPLYSYMPALDGLRGVSILWVLSIHLPGQMYPNGNLITNRGGLGVELFFAISGFLVTRSLHQCIARQPQSEGSKRPIVRDFIVRRVSRIWPPYFATLLALLLAAGFDAGLRAKYLSLADTLWSYPTFLANYAIPYQEPPLSLLVTWSLCFEEQFYLILIGLYVLSAGRLARLLLGCALASIAARLVVAAFFPEIFSKYVLQMQPQWRFDALAWGCLGWLFHEQIAALWRRVTHPRILENAILLVAIAACAPFPLTLVGAATFYIALAPALTVLVLALALSPGFWLAKVLAWRPIAFVGVISYEIYLSHVTVFRMLGKLGLEQTSLLFYGLCLGVSILLGWLFHRFFSRPAQDWIRAWLVPRRAQA